MHLPMKEVEGKTHWRPEPGHVEKCLDDFVGSGEIPNELEIAGSSEIVSLG